LYAVNTAGAVLGPLLAVFALFPAVGLTKTLYVAAGADFLVLFSVFLARRALPGLSGSTSLALLPKGERPAILLVAAMAVSGASAMVYEVAWSRTLSLVYGSSIYGVSIMLSTYLLGIAFGSALASFLLRRRTAPISYRVASWLLIGSSGGAYASLLVTRNLPYVFLNLYRSAPERDLTLFIIQFVVAAALMLPATLCLGAMLPAVVAALPSSKTDLGHRVAWLYTANLVGAATGAVLAAGVLLGSFGIDLSVRVASLVALTAAMLLAAAGKVGSRAPLTVSATIGLVILAFNPTGELLVMSFGLYTHPQDSSRDPSSLRELVESHRLVYYRDGPSATVAVQKINRFILLKINGKTDASNGPGDVSTQLMLGHLPFAVAHADRVAVIGWGSGMTAGAILRHPVESVDAFEIEPAVVEASRFFEPGNGKPLDDPRLRLVMGDARSELLRTNQDYDLIVSEPSNPWITGVSNLFTRDFFEIISSKLKPNGIVCQWFHLYGMSEESTRSLLATFRSVFPHALAFKDRDLILLGSQRPIQLSMSRASSFFEEPAIQEQLASAFIRYPADIIAELSLDDAGMASFSQGAPINTDDNLLLELAAPRSLYLDRTDAIRGAMRRHPPAVIEALTDYDSAADAHLELAASYFTAGKKEDALAACLRALEAGDSFEGLKLLGQTLQSLGRIEEAREALGKALLQESEDAQGKRFVERLLRSLDEVTP
ncbi:MAG: hypothetical protein ACRD1X_08200, partial [Vicinamibacteria bacterium]